MQKSFVITLNRPMGHIAHPTFTSGNVSVINTSNDTIVGSFAVGYGEYPNSGDGDEPTGIVMTTTLTPGH